MSNPEAFTTRSIEPSVRAETWGRYLANFYFDMDVRMKDNEIVHGEILKRTFGAISFSRVAVSSSRVIRRRQSAQADKVERFCFVFPTRGTFDHCQHGVKDRSDPGGVFIVNSAEAYEIYHGDAANVCLTVPCDLIRARVRGIDDLCSRNGVGDGTIVSALRHLTQETLLNGSRTNEARFEDLCIDMLELMLSRSNVGTIAGAAFRRPGAREQAS